MSTKCSVCGENAVTRQVVPEYQDDLLGMPVLLRDCVVHEVCDNCGEETFEIPDEDQLEAAIVMARINIPVKLSGAEIKFIRRTLGMTGREFADLLDSDPATLSRWENNGQALGGYADKNLRHAAGALLSEQVPAIPYDPEAIVRMKLVACAEDAPLPPLEFGRVKVRAARQVTDEWDRAA